MSRAKIDRTNEIGYNNNGERMTIIRYGNNADIDVQFEDGTVIKNRQYSDFKKGKINNPMTPSVYGFGFIGIGKFKTCDKNGKHTKCYDVWIEMLRRCYDSKFHKKEPTYRGCIVCPEWHNYQVFAEWFYEHYYELENEIMNLDKDILKKGNKVYSADTCVFVPASINNLFTKRNNERGEYPIGVCKEGNKVKAQLSKNGKQIYLGSFDTPKQAFEVYKQAKEQYMKEVAKEYEQKIPQKVYERMITYEVEIDD